MLAEDLLSGVKTFGLIFTGWTTIMTVRVRVMSSFEALSLEGCHRDSSAALLVVVSKTLKRVVVCQVIC